jgi:hypothetical protein
MVRTSTKYLAAALAVARQRQRDIAELKRILDNSEQAYSSLEDEIEELRAGLKNLLKRKSP